MFRFETAGESHGECLVATLTGLPAGIPIALDALNHELWRRQQGYGHDYYFMATFVEDHLRFHMDALAAVAT